MFTRRLYACLACATVTLAWAVRGNVAHRKVFAVALGGVCGSCGGHGPSGEEGPQDLTLYGMTTPRTVICMELTPTVLLMMAAVAVVAFVAPVIMMRRVTRARIVVLLAGTVLGLYSMPVLMGNPDGRPYASMLTCVVLTVPIAIMVFGVGRPISDEETVRVPAIGIVAGSSSPARSGLRCRAVPTWSLQSTRISPCGSRWYDNSARLNPAERHRSSY